MTAPQTARSGAPAARVSETPGDTAQPGVSQTTGRGSGSPRPVPPRVVGLDLSLTATGIAAFPAWFETAGREGITTLSLHQREEALTNLADEITSIIGAPDLVVIEQTAFSKAYGGAAERSGLWWMVVRKLRTYSVPVAEVKATALKRYATGKGQCDKGAIVDAVARRWPSFETGGNDNVCDAIVLAAMGLDHLGQPPAVMPAANRAALDKVRWPSSPEGTS